MRILFDVSPLATRTRRTGIGRYIADLGRQLDQIAGEAHIDVLSLERILPGRAPRVASNLRESIESLLSSSSLQHHYDWAYRVRIGLAAATRRVNPDLVHSGHPNATPVGRLSCPRIVTCHDLIPLRYPAHYLTIHDGFEPGRRRLDHRRYHGADHVIAVSRATADDLLGMLGLSVSKISVVYNGVDLSRWKPPTQDFTPWLAERGIVPGAYVVYAGAADYRKNADGMFRAIQLARERSPCSELVLAWVGPLRDPERERLQKLALDMGVSDAVRLLGYVTDEELSLLYGNALCQLFVSRAEGFGYPLLEAMATGCPSVTSNCSSLVELAGDAAWTVDPERPEQAADAIETLARDSVERQRLADRGRRRAAEFSLDRCARETVEVYRTVARG